MVLLICFFISQGKVSVLMCFSKNVSMFTLLTGILGGALCYSTGLPGL